MKNKAFFLAFSCAFIGLVSAGSSKQLASDSALTKFMAEARVKEYELSKALDSESQRIKYLEIKHGIFDSELKNITAIYGAFVAFALGLNFVVAYFKLQSEKKELTAKFNLKLSAYE